MSEALRSGGATLRFEPGAGYLKALLAALEIPIESQVLVFSETSAEAERIKPDNPRALYFDDTVSVGWVRGGQTLEIAATDREQGVHFYTLDQRRAERPQFAKGQRCLECHQTLDTLGVPGLLVFSQFSMPQDKYSYATGSVMDHRSPFNERWGGWYVTGHSAERHIGNVKNLTGLQAMEGKRARELETVEGEFDAKGYLTPHSDIVALMVLEHQTHMTNLLTRIGWEARLLMSGQASPAPPKTSGLSLGESAAEVVDYLLFLDEAPLSGKVRGSSRFAERFSSSGPRDRSGRSLRDFDLERRMMKYRCSYLIYSPAFDALPAPARDAIYERMWRVLSAQAEPPSKLALADRRAVVEILQQTKKGLPSYFQLPTK